MKINKESSYGWIVTKDFIDLIEDQISGPSGTPFTPDEICKNGEYFEMFDGDGVKYYSGYMYATGGYTDTEKALFSPLDDYGIPNAGAMDIKYRNKDGRMESV